MMLFKSALFEMTAIYNIQAWLPAVSNRTFGSYLVYNYSDNTKNFLLHATMRNDDF